MPATRGVEAPTASWFDDEFLKSVKRRDPERLAGAHYTPEARLIAPGRGLIQGRAAIEEYWRDLFRRGLVDMRRESEWTEADGALACAGGRYTLTVEAMPGLPHTERGRFLAVYRKSGEGVWQVAAESDLEGE